MDADRELAWLRRVHEHAARLTDGSDHADLLPRILDGAVELTGAERGFLVQVVGRKPDGGYRIRVRVARGFDNGQLRRDPKHVSRTVVERVLAQGEGLVTSREEDGDVLEVSSVVERRVRSIICAPMRLRGELRGVIYLDHRFEQGAFAAQDLPILTTFAGQAALALETAELLRAEASGDPRGEGLREIEAIRRADPEPLAPADLRMFGSLIGASHAMCRLYDQLERVARTTHTVLIQGESGTGKELVAREIHARSVTRDEPFLSENCGALSEGLLESELFGHRQGAFTGATRDREGLFREAGRGTLLLDEVAEMSPDVQKKLLRVLQEGCVRPVGSDALVPVHCRVLAATHRDLGELVREGRFREDLFYRLDVMRLTLPPLREREGDVELLLRAFLVEAGVRKTELSPKALELLQAYAWPGNVRQLKNEALRLAVESPHRVSALQLSDEIREGRGVTGAPALQGAQTMGAMQKAMVEAALQNCDGNRSRAARQLGIPRTTLYSLMKRYGLW